MCQKKFSNVILELYNARDGKMYPTHGYLARLDPNGLPDLFNIRVGSGFSLKKTRSGFRSGPGIRHTRPEPDPYI